MKKVMQKSFVGISHVKVDDESNEFRKNNKVIASQSGATSTEGVVHFYCVCYYEVDV